MALKFIAIDPDTDREHCPRFHHFSGDGEIVEDELCDDPAVIARCMTAFEAVWDRAVPHADYRLG